MVYQTKNHDFRVGDILICEGDKPLHRKKLDSELDDGQEEFGDDGNYVKLLMVVLEVKGRIAKTKYINAEEIRELERWKPRKNKRNKDEKQGVLFNITKKSDLIKGFQMIRYTDPERIYENDMSRLHDPEMLRVSKIYIDYDDKIQALDILTEYQRGKKND